MRLMYFFNVIDTFLPFSILCLLGWVQTNSLSSYGLPPITSPLIFICSGFVFLYVCCKIADFHVLFLTALPVVVLLTKRATPFWATEVFTALLLFFAFTSLVQIVFMGLPMSLASRSPAVAMRMYLNSFLVLAPTTISLPVTVGYQLIMFVSLRGVLVDPFSLNTAYICISVLGIAVLTRLFMKRTFIPPTYHPPISQDAYSRVILLNIDGLSYHAFKNAKASFLHHLEKEFAYAPGGASTVYKAFTNPAFASILSGSEPARHRVFNNNFGQNIKIEALPDIVDTRLYGSMHIKHFSRKEWSVTLVSLVELSYDKADEALMRKLKEGLKFYSQVRLWVVDLSMVDYCGHAWGSYSRQYYDAIEKLDSVIKGFFKWCLEEFFLNDTLFIISSDHGLFIGEHAYILFPQEEFVPLMFIGRDIRSGTLPQKTSILDIAANISFFLGQAYCKESRGRVFTQINQWPCSEDFVSRLGIEEVGDPDGPKGDSGHGPL